MFGTRKNVATSTTVLMTAKMPIAASYDQWVVTKVVIGTPSTMPAETPTKTRAMPREGSSLVAAAASVKAMAT